MGRREREIGAGEGRHKLDQKGHFLLVRDHGRHHRLLLHLLFITSQLTPIGALSLGDNMGGATVGSATVAFSLTRPTSSDIRNCTANITIHLE